MSKRSFKLLPKIKSYSIQKNTVNPLLFYVTLVFLIRFADGLMSYISPLYIESQVHNTLYMGIIISLSSVVGLMCDVIFGRIFHDKKYAFFLFWGIIGAIIFPLTYLYLPPIALVFIFSMAVWGIYFELVRFSDFHFINRYLPHQDHALGWGVLTAAVAAAYMLAPVIAALLLDIQTQLTFKITILVLIITLIGFALLKLVFGTPKTHSSPNIYSKNIFHELRLWKVLATVLWPVLLFVFIIAVLDAVFWTSGAIISEELKTYGFPGGILFIAYLAPALFVSLLAGKIAKPFGKKKAAYSSGLMAGVFFTIAGMAASPLFFLIAVFLGSIFIAISLPEINGTIEDYISRLGHTSNSMIGLGNSMNSLAYIIGPILAGLIALHISHQITFTVIGVLLILTALIALIRTPRKIRLPQQAIHRLEDALKQI